MLVTTDDKHYKDMANVLRANGPYFEDEFRPEEMAEKFQHMANYKHGLGLNEGYSVGYEAGKAEGGGGNTEAAYQQGVTDGIEQGKQAEYDRFWNSLQNYGDRRKYGYAFAQTTWTDIVFKPKYPLIATEAAYMFNNCKFNDIDFVEQGVVLDVSSATSLTYLFRECTGIKRVGTIDCTGCKDLNRLFYNSSIKTIDEFKVSEAITYDNTFTAAGQLENITITGKIGNNITFAGTPLLTKESINSILDALAEVSSTKTITFKKATIDASFTEDEWTVLDAIAVSKNWTITLT